MLKEILSIPGKPGLFKLISQGKNMLVVESLVDGKRMPAYTKDKVVSLGDIAIFTEDAEIPLGQVLEKVKAKENAELCTIDSKASNDVLKQYMAEVLPEYDKERVYPSDIRKLINWYNILVKASITEFISIDESNSETAE